MTRVHMDLDMEVADFAEFRGYLRDLADWLEERGMMDADLMHYGRRVGRIETGEGDVPLRYVRDEEQGGHAPRVRVRELDPDVPALLDQGQGPEAPDDRAGGGRPMTSVDENLSRAEADIRSAMERLSIAEGDVLPDVREFIQSAAASLRVAQRKIQVARRLEDEP